MLQALAPEHRGEMPPRLRVMALDEPEAFGRAIRWHGFTHDRDKVGLLAFPMPQVAAIEADNDRLWGLGQDGTVT